MKGLMLYKIISALLIVLASTTGLNADTINLAEQSLPGDVLYPVKLAIEDYKRKRKALNLPDPTEE